MAKTLDQELAEIHRELATYGTKGSDTLTKALEGNGISKGKKAPPPPPADEDEDEGFEDEDEGDEDEDFEDEDEGDEDEEDAPPPPTKKSRAASTGRTAAPARARADEKFLKSLLFDSPDADEDEGDTDMREVIEATPVLTHMADTFAKSLGDMDEQVADVALAVHRGEKLSKALAYTMLDIRRELKEMRKLIESQPAAAPASAAAFSLEKSMPQGKRKKAADEAAPLSKSKAGDAIRAAATYNMLDEDTARAALLSLDSQGVEYALSLIENTELQSSIRQLSAA